MTVTLEKWQERFIPAVAEYANNQKIAVNLRDGFPQPYTRKDAEAYVKGCIETGDDGQLCRAILADGEAVGSVGVFLREGGSAELGYWLGEPFWGRGIMTNAVRELCAEAFAQFDLRRVFAVPYESNKASHRVLEKAGFQYEGLTESCGCSRGVNCLYTLAQPAAHDMASCGCLCDACKDYQKTCAGCRALQGRVWWTQHIEAAACPLYLCCVEKKGFAHCGKCPELPCAIFSDCKDPSMTGEEHEATIRERVTLLRSRL